MYNVLANVSLKSHGKYNALQVMVDINETQTSF